MPESTVKLFEVLTRLTTPSQGISVTANWFPVKQKNNCKYSVYYLTFDESNLSNLRLDIQFTV